MTTPSATRAIVGAASFVVERTRSIHGAAGGWADEWMPSLARWDVVVVMVVFLQTTVMLGRSWRPEGRCDVETFDWVEVRDLLRLDLSPPSG
jgi:hypothetical protein